MTDVGCRPVCYIRHPTFCIQARRSAAGQTPALALEYRDLPGDPAMQSFRLDSQIALVTSAYSGLGAAVAVALAEAGADVAVHDTGSSVRTRPAPASGSAGRRAVPITGDLADVSEPARLVADVLGAFGRLDILVSHACPPAADAVPRERVGRPDRGPAVEHLPSLSRLRRLPARNQTGGTDHQHRRAARSPPGPGSRGDDRRHRAFHARPRARVGAARDCGERHRPRFRPHR